MVVAKGHPTDPSPTTERTEPPAGAQRFRRGRRLVDLNAEANQRSGEHLLRGLACPPGVDRNLCGPKAYALRPIRDVQRTGFLKPVHERDGSAAKHVKPEMVPTGQKWARPLDLRTVPSHSWPVLGDPASF